MANSKGFKIKDNFDIETQNGLFVFNYDRNEVAQRVRHELLTIQGEITEEPLRGLNVFGVILGKTSSKTERKQEIYRALSYVPELTVNNIIEEQQQRVVRYYINATYQGITDIVEFEVQ